MRQTWCIWAAQFCDRTQPLFNRANNKSQKRFNYWTLKSRNIEKNAKAKTHLVMVYEVTKQQFLLWVVFATYFRTHKRGVQNLREWTNQDSYGRAGRRPSAAKVSEQSQKENDRKATLQTHSIKAPIFARICGNYLLERFLSWVKTETLRLFLIIFFYVCIFRTPAIISSEISCQILDQSRGKANPVDTFLGIFTRAWRQLNVQVFTSNFNCINWTMSGIKILKKLQDTWLYEAVVKSISLTAFGQTQL